ncbi:hypothetical protein TNCV_243221 [Trichonephila clavipes]|uniref:Uncharacterized protein n=1 Tax=Trichonephila clavipes TaxID=2585209 RepID=A0A8X7BEU9_TRICX|nr:hypothetical protein TNCV_243221 [Trichonephila clavipes]
MTSFETEISHVKKITSNGSKKKNQNVEGVIVCDAPCDSESVVLCDNKSVLHGNVSVVLSDNVSVVLSDNVSVVLPDNVSVVLSENQSVVFSGNSDSMVNDMVDCANYYSVAKSDFVCLDCLKIFTNK